MVKIEQMGGPGTAETARGKGKEKQLITKGRQKGQQVLGFKGKCSVSFFRK